jgi:hypothetical protein
VLKSTSVHRCDDGLSSVCGGGTFLCKQDETANCSLKIVVIDSVIARKSSQKALCGYRRSKVDKELRSVREAEHLKPDEVTIKAVVEQCRRQQELHDERISSGVSVCEWLRAPSLSGAAGGHSTRPTLQGSVSLAGPAEA